jgi:L-cysteine/cystine lyase
MATLAPRLSAIREEFPVFERLAYLNTGTSGPLARRTVRAITAQTERQLLQGRSSFKVFLEEYFPLLDDLRARFGRLLGADADEIALTHHTTEGMNVAIWGLNWHAGDEIITTTEEHDGASLPVYLAARRQGLTLRVVDVGSDDADIVERLARAITPRTRLVVVSHVFFKTGTVLPVAEIADAAHRAGALLAVDGAQSAGAIPIDVHALGVDAYAIPGQKWLCGPEGLGALYVRRDRVTELSPTFVGFFSLRDFTAYDDSGYFIPAPGARRYEVGTVFWPALLGMLASLQWMEDELGYDAIYDQGAAVTRRCRQMLAEVPGLTIHSPARYAGLTSFSVDGLDPMATALALAETGVVIRSVHAPDLLRVSTGFYNDESDVRRLCDGRISLRKGGG